MLHLIAQVSCLWSANDTKHCILVIKTELQVFEVNSMHQLLYPFTCHLTYKPSTVTIFCFICKVWKDPKILQVPVRQHWFYCVSCCTYLCRQLLSCTGGWFMFGSLERPLAALSWFWSWQNHNLPRSAVAAGCVPQPGNRVPKIRNCRESQGCDLSV